MARMLRGPTIALAVALLAALAPTTQAASTPVPMEQFRGLPPAAKADVSPAAKQLRDELLGRRWRNRRVVTLNWIGVSSFIVTIRRHVLLFDAWEILGLHADYMPIGREELAGLEPEAILLGHGHFDHAGDAGYVAGRGGAAVLASYEQCGEVKEDAAAEGNAENFRCVITGSQTTPAFGARRRVRLFRDLPKITVLKGVHSAPGPPSERNPADPFLPVFDPAPYIEHLNTDPAEMLRFIDYFGDPEGGTRMYHLRLGRFTLLFGDSAGPLHEHKRLRVNLGRLPGCVDVLASAILGFDQPVAGLAAPRRYVRRAKPKVFLPTHGDAWAPVISGGQAAYRDELAAQLAGLRSRPRVDYLLDPQDYMKARSYRVGANRWGKAVPGSHCARR